jgi:hypothetical protein
MGLASQIWEVIKSDTMVKKSDPLLLDAQSPSLPADETAEHETQDSSSITEKDPTENEVRARGIVLSPWRGCGWMTMRRASQVQVRQPVGPENLSAPDDDVSPRGPV